MLNQPYPIPTTSGNLKTNLIIGLFISLFLMVFQPFGLNAHNEPNNYLFIAGYGLVTFLVLTIDNLIINVLYKTRSGKTTWTVKKQIVMLLLILFTIGAGNYFYSAWVIDFKNPVIGFLVFQFFTTAVGLLPISIITILNENIRNKAFLKEATSMNEGIPALNKVDDTDIPILLTAENDKSPFIIGCKDFLYAESAGNYLDVRYLKDGKATSVLLRTTLTRAEIQMGNHSGVMKCHRAFLVNCDQIVHVKGNAQGLRLQLNHTSEEIPVSRTFIKNLRTKMLV